MTSDTNQSDSACLPGMVFSAQQHTATVDAVRLMAKDTWAVKLRQPELAASITPGQFFMVRPASGSDPLLGRPFALYDIYRDDNGNPAGIEFGFVVVGKLTSLMTSWKQGDSVQLWGPLGNGFPMPTCERLICVAGGIGQTPFLGVAREALGHETYGNAARNLESRPKSVTLCYGVRSKDYVAGLDDFQVPGLSVKVATDDGSHGHSGTGYRLAVGMSGRRYGLDSCLLLWSGTDDARRGRNLSAAGRSMLAVSGNSDGLRFWSLFQLRHKGSGRRRLMGLPPHLRRRPGIRVSPTCVLSR